MAALTTAANQIATAVYSKWYLKTAPMVRAFGKATALCRELQALSAKGKLGRTLAFTAWQTAGGIRGSRVRVVGVYHVNLFKGKNGTYYVNAYHDVVETDYLWPILGGDFTGRSYVRSVVDLQGQDCPLNCHAALNF
jgi:hypothetical protein